MNFKKSPYKTQQLGAAGIINKLYAAAVEASLNTVILSMIEHGSFEINKLQNLLTTSPVYKINGVYWVNGSSSGKVKTDFFFFS